MADLLSQQALWKQLKRPLPSYPRRNKDKSVSNPSLSASAVIIPNAGMPRDLTYWTNLTVRLVKKFRMDALKTLNVQPWLSRNNAIEHHSEADVVRTSGENLLRAIELVMHTGEYKLESRSEVTITMPKPPDPKNPPATKQTPKIPDKYEGRSDVAFFMKDQQIAFAILEYKKRDVIDVQSFEAGLPPPLKSGSQMLSPHANRQFGIVAVKLLHQAGLYARLHRTRYVALFDWDTLVLIVFDKCVAENWANSLPTDGNLNAGAMCDITICKEKHLMRAALLGFLLRAWQGRLNAMESKPDEDDIADMLDKADLGNFPNDVPT